MALPGTGQQLRPSSHKSAWESWAGRDLRTCVQWPQAAELATRVGVLELALLWSAHARTGTPLMEARGGVWTVQPLASVAVVTISMHPH